jgi:hypothetical protein
MIFCTNNRCPLRWDCLRFKAAPQPGEGRMLWTHPGCQHFIRDRRLDQPACEAESCRR